MLVRNDLSLGNGILSKSNNYVLLLFIRARKEGSDMRTSSTLLAEGISNEQGISPFKLNYYNYETAQRQTTKHR